MSDHISAGRLPGAVLAVLTVIAGPGGRLLAAESAPRKPNLLFIWTDEQRADTMAV